MKSKQFCIATILVVHGLMLAASIQAQDDPPAPVEDPTINAVGDVASAKMATRMRAVKFALRFKVIKEKRKLPWKRDKELIAKYETLLESPEFLDYIVEEGTQGFDEVESQYFEARGPPTASAFGDGVLLEKILEWIDNGGLDKILKFILALIDAFAGV